MASTLLNYNRIVESVQAVHGKESLDIFAFMRVNADTHRILHALAMPEYMETWLQFPETDRVEFHTDRMSRYSLRIDLYSSVECRGCIRWECVLSRPDRIIYLWESSNEGNRSRSVVDICLCGALGRCSLKLKHRGFRNIVETDWHSRMWQSSLENLCCVMEGTGFPFGAPKLTSPVRPFRREMRQTWPVINQISSPILSRAE